MNYWISKQLNCLALIDCIFRSDSSLNSVKLPCSHLVSRLSCPFYQHTSRSYYPFEWAIVSRNSFDHLSFHPFLSVVFAIIDLSFKALVRTNHFNYRCSASIKEHLHEFLLEQCFDAVWWSRCSLQLYYSFDFGELPDSAFIDWIAAYCLNVE